MSVLVAVGSRHGATREIAEAIGSELRRCGVEAEVREIEDVQELTGYDAVVLGSAVYMGRWLEPARRFVEQHLEELLEMPVWLFSSGPIGDPPTPEEEPTDAAAVSTTTHAREHRVFAGALVTKELGFAERAVTRVVRVKEGDYRDWQEIATWAAGIAEALRTLPQRAPAS